jgi:hypothetical protein
VLPVGFSSILNSGILDPDIRCLVVHHPDANAPDAALAYFPRAGHPSRRAVSEIAITFQPALVFNS